MPTRGREPPEMDDARTAVTAIRGLAASSPFRLEKDAVDGGRLHLHLRYPVGAGRGGAVEAWVMAFAPFDFVPNTRRAGTDISAHAALSAQPGAGWTKFLRAPDSPFSPVAAA